MDDAPQPVLPHLIRPRFEEIAARAEAAQMLCLDTLPDGAITPSAAQALGVVAQGIRRELDAACETMRLKITSLDCVQAIARELPAGGMSEAALYHRLWRRGFRSPEQRAAIAAMIERGAIVRMPAAERAPGARGPMPHRLMWRTDTAPT